MKSGVITANDYGRESSSLEEGMMSNQLMDFADRTGQEMFRLLAERALAELAQTSGFDRFTAILAAALIPVAEVLREPIEKARDASAMTDDMIELISRQLRQLLEPVTGRGHAPRPPESDTGAT